MSKKLRILFHQFSKLHQQNYLQEAFNDSPSSSSRQLVSFVRCIFSFDLKRCITLLLDSYFLYQTFYIHLKDIFPFSYLDICTHQIRCKMLFYGFLSFEIIESRYMARKRSNQFLPGSFSGNNKQVDFLSFLFIRIFG